MRRIRNEEGVKKEITSEIGGKVGKNSGTRGRGEGWTDRGEVSEGPGAARPQQVARNASSRG